MLLSRSLMSFTSNFKFTSASPSTCPACSKNPTPLENMTTLDSGKGLASSPWASSARITLGRTKRPTSAAARKLFRQDARCESLVDIVASPQMRGELEIADENRPRGAYPGLARRFYDDQ